MLLNRLLRALASARQSGSGDVDITDIAYDSRQVVPGGLFVAVPSVGGDGSSGGVRFLPEAIERGAASVVVPEGVEIEGVRVVHTPDTRAALADLSAAFFEYPSRALSLYAVTGTDGKTTTAYLLEQILAAAGWTTGMIGTVEIKVGRRRQRNLDRMTTPESLDLQRLLREMVDAGVTHAVMEASSHAIALQRLRGLEFDACALTNITHDHVEFHGSWEQYFAAKASLFTDLADGRPAVLNRDDSSFDRLSTLISGPVVPYGIGEGDVRAVDVRPGERGTAFVLEAGGERAPVRLGLPGAFNVSNALAAAGLALQAGLSVAAVAAALSEASAPPGRFEAISLGQPFTVLVDYAHTMHAFRSVLAAVRDMTDGRAIVVFGAAGNRDRGKRPVLARIAREYADVAIVTNEDPYGEEPESIIDEILAGVGEEERDRFVREPDRETAIRRAVQEALPGDTVVILGKGHERSIVVNGDKTPWSDQEVVRAAIEATS